MGLTDAQAYCVETLDRPLVVAAGAGSGKTFTLTKRIVGAFEGTPERGPFVNDIDEICAITFTKKAAGELKSRIKAELRARGLVDQALRVDDAWISTIHGMCSRILRSHAVELGIDPSFEIAEQAQLDEYYSRAIDAVLVEARAEPSPALDALFAEYGVRTAGPIGNSVEKMLGKIIDVASGLPNGIDDLRLPGVTVAPEIAVERAIEIVETFMAEAETIDQGVKRDKWISSASDALEAAYAVRAQGISDPMDALRAVASLKLAKDFGKADFKARVTEARGELGSCIMEIRLGAAREHLQTLLKLARRVYDAVEEYKRADGLLSNNDLLVMAARALEEHPTIAAQYANKFKLVMVDEFQDTDQMQVDMIKRLAGEGAVRLCTVGDAQQSIYRFRGADVSVYRRHLNMVREDWPDSVVELSDNFRSHGDVLAFVDRVFEKPDMFGGEFMSLGHGRREDEVKKPFSGSLPRIVVQHTSKPRGVSSAQLLEASARRLADEFAKLVKAGHKPGDMVVLLKRMKNADVFAQALRDKGLPCVVSGGSVFATMEEAQVMELLARVVANPLDTQALLSVLVSPLFSLTAGDLLRVGGVEGFWRAAFADERDDSAASPQLVCALRVMAAMWRHIGEAPSSRIMSRVLVDSGWLSRKQDEGAEGLASAANALKAIRMVEGIERSGAFGPASVARRFTDALAHAKEAPGALSVSGGDSVRIMTVHSSKGLEFPIVAIAEMAGGPSKSSPLMVSTSAGKAYVSLDLGQSLKSIGGVLDDDTALQVRNYVLGDVSDEEALASAVADEAGALHRRLAISAYEKAGDEEEAKRLLYVALTRAKEALVVSVVGNCTKANPTGVPQNGVLASVFTALDPAGVDSAAGRWEYEFGGETKAVLECVALEVADEPEQVDEAPVEDDRPLFMVPAPEEAPAVARETYKPLHQGVFSYSSISDAAHEGDLLRQLADAHTVSVDVGVDVDVADDTGDAAGTSFGSSAFQSGMPWQPQASFGDDFWDFDVSQAFDEDRATDLGTAFHRLAQYAVVARGEEGPLAMPPAERVEALSRSCNLDAEQRLRLNAALRRWFGCDAARDMASLYGLAPEVPFFVAVPNAAGGHDYLEGEIDLLGFDEGRAHATVVDYKTGGRDDEIAADLRCKHVLQASCYAYAVMLQGVAEVDAVFVRVERPRDDDSNQPQCVRYRFVKDDIPQLARVIAEAYARL